MDFECAPLADGELSFHTPRAQNTNFDPMFTKLRIERLSEANLCKLSCAIDRFAIKCGTAYRENRNPLRTLTRMSWSKSSVDVSMRSL